MTWVFAILFAAWLATIAALARGRRAKGGASERWGRWLWTQHALLLGLLVLEGGAWLLTPPASDAIAFTPAHRAWERRYWHPINAMGFRDVEHDWHELRGKSMIFVVGDSIAAGHGIDDMDDRFSSRLSACVPTDWHVVTLALNGWNTRQQLDFLEGFPRAPDILVWSYFMNDIDDCAEEAFEARGVGQSQGMNLAAAILLMHSHFFSKLILQYYIPARFEGFMRRSKEAYEDRSVWDCHESELRRVAEYARQNDAAPIFVLWSWPDTPETPSYGRVTGLLDELSIPYIHSTDLVEGTSLPDLVVSANDAHPNAKYHGRIGDALCEWVQPWVGSFPSGESQTLDRRGTSRSAKPHRRS